MAQRKLEIDDRVGGQDRDEDFAARDRHRHDEGIDQHGGDRLARRAARADEDGAVIVLQKMRARRQRHLAVGDDRRLVRRGDERDVDRERHDGDADPQDQMRDEVPVRAPLDH